MRWWHRLRRHFRQAAGVVLLLVGLMLVVSWMQSDDPECSDEQELFTQLRMCEEREPDKAHKPASDRTAALWLLIVGLTGFAAGAYLLASGNTARPPDEADS